MFFNALYAIADLLVGNVACVAENDAPRILDLVIEKFTEILHMHLALVGVNNGGKSVKLRAVCVGILNRFDNVRKLTYTRRLDKYSVGRIFIDDLFKSLREVAYQGTTDATGVHFVDFYACFGKETAVDTDLAEFVFDKHDFFAVISFFNELFYKCSFTRAQKA